MLTILISSFFISTNSLMAESLSYHSYNNVFTGDNFISNSHDETIGEANLQSDNSSNSVYSLMIRNITPKIKAGDTIQIELFISGYGIPQKNKLIISWSSSYVIDKINAGFYTTFNSEPRQIDPAGIIYDFPQSNFAISTLGYEPADYGLPFVITERAFNGIPPLWLRINTVKTAPSGDYDISFIFTYGDDQNMSQDYKTTQFHVMSNWEKNEQWLTILAVVIAALSLLASAVVSIWELIINLRKKGLSSRNKPVK